MLYFLIALVVVTYAAFLVFLRKHGRDPYGGKKFVVRFTPKGGEPEEPMVFDKPVSVYFALEALRKRRASPRP